MIPGHETPLPIVILSGGTGRTADHVLTAALAQFDDPHVQILRHTQIRQIRAARRIIKQAADQKAIVCHTLVEPRVRAAASEELLRLNVPAVDPLGPLISLLADHLGAVPLGRAGLLYELRKEQFDRSDAVDFTLAHDDGQRVHDLERADVVLVGVSRVSKSVTCFYLAGRGVRAANVPLTTSLAVPPELEQIEPGRVIGLTMNASRLCAVRQARLDRITRQPVPRYAEHREVTAELRHAAEAMQQHGWRCIDVSYKSTEDVASEIIEMLRGKKART
jgi:regulator of PEP synthase PpsR (kinase-PPPase family)